MATKEWRTDSILIEYLKKNEGLRLKPYTCPSGYLTIGYGRNLESKGITQLESELMLLNDIQDVSQQLDDILPWWRSINESSQRVLIDMCFNLGMRGLLKFEKMLGLLKAHHYSAAASELINSKYAKQVGERAKRNFYYMRGA